MMNNDANPFAVYEPNTAAGPEDLGNTFDLARAAERAARTGSVFGGSDPGAASTQFPPPSPGLGMNPLGPKPLPTRQSNHCPKRNGRAQLSLNTIQQNSF